MAEEKKYLYSIYDRVAERYSPPSIAVNDQVAARNAAEQISQSLPKHLWDEYWLMKLGEIDMISGKIKVGKIENILINFTKVEMANAEEKKE